MFLSFEFWLGIGVRRHTYAALPLHASILFGVNMGVRRQNRSPPMPPFLCLAGLTQKIAGKAAAPLRRPSFISRERIHG